MTIQDVDPRVSSSNGFPKKLFGYEVLEHLGEGAGSNIYVVTDRSDGQIYALKHVIRKTEKDERYILQLQNEFDVSRLFRHPGLRKYINVKVKRSLLFQVREAALIMEHVDGISLDKQRPTDMRAIVNIFEQTAMALAGLHYLVYVHCDLKPNNILVNAEGKVKLIDFGQACKIGTVKKRIQGTADFMAPEQVKLFPVTVQTDVYGFGATLYWTLTGRTVPTMYTVKKSERDIVREGKFPTPRELNPAVPEALSDLTMECVKASPAWRPSGMDDVLKRLKFLGL